MERRVLRESPDEAVIPQKQVGCFLYPVFFSKFLSYFKICEHWIEKKKGVIIKYSAVYSNVFCDTCMYCC